MCPLAVIAAEIADINIECDAGDLWPGVNGEVGFGEDDGAGDTSRLTAGVVEGMEQPADDGQAVALAGVDAERFECRSVEQEARSAATVVEVSDQVQAVHMTILWGFT